MRWVEAGGGWVAELHDPSDRFSKPEDVAIEVFALLRQSSETHAVLEWQRFITKTYSDERGFFDAAARDAIQGQPSTISEYAPVFSTQLAVESLTGPEHFDHPFRAARKDYYPGNLQSVITSTQQEHIVRTIARPWDYGDAMANQSLRLDHGDDRRHAYQWHAPTEDPARQKNGCMLGANRLAIESFPLFPCIPATGGSTAVGFEFKSRTQAWVNWPVWGVPCSLAVVASLLNSPLIHGSEPDMHSLRKMGVLAVLRSRRLPIEKNKVFLPPETF
ncbi:MAG: hypothetical protein ABIP85_22720 [Chthoniobacteraceae bacterium]